MKKTSDSLPEYAGIVYGFLRFAYSASRHTARRRAYVLAWHARLRAYGVLFVGDMLCFARTIYSVVESAVFVLGARCIFAFSYNIRDKHIIYQYIVNKNNITNL